MFSSFISRGPSPAKLFSTSTTNVDEIILRDDVADYIGNADGQSQRCVLSYTEKNLARIIGALQRNLPPKAFSNVALLLVRFVQFHPNQTDAIRRVVPSAIGLFARKGLLSSHVAAAVQRILLAAFDEDFSQTSYAINITLGDEIIHGAIRNIASSTVVSETIIAIFGSALSATSMMLPSTTPNIFTDVWIKHQFPAHAAAYCRIAMSSFELQPYFLFMQELLKRGLSHSAGPVVDSILSPATIGELVNAVIECCEATQQDPAAFPLACDGVSVLASVVALMRRTLPPTESLAQYQATIRAVAPLDALTRCIPRFTSLLISLEGARSVGCTRQNIAELLLELLACQLKEIDSALASVEIFKVLGDVAFHFPNNDFIAKSLEKSIMTVFSRKPLTKSGGTDVLMQSLVTNSFPIRRIIPWMVDTTLTTTTLQSHCISLALQLNELVDFQSSPSESPVFGNLFQQVLQVDLAQRLLSWMSPITGSRFSERGSGCPSFVVIHRQVVDPQNVSIDSLKRGGQPLFDDSVNIRAPTAPLPEISTSVSSSTETRRSRYASNSPVEDDLDAPKSTDDGFSKFDFGGSPGVADDDEVNLDDEEPIKQRESTSMESQDEEEWVEQTIHDVSEALDSF